MSSPLATVDLTGAVVGTTAQIDFSQFVKFDPAKQDIKAHLRVYNDSGCGLSYRMQVSGNGDYIPAGGWATIELADNDNLMGITVLYVLPNPPVSIILPTYYAPGEPVPPVPILGNSPVGIGGNVQTTSIQSLINDGQPRGTQIIESTALTDGRSILVDNTGNVTITGNNAGTMTQLFQTLANNPLSPFERVRLAVTGVLTRIQGTLAVDQDASFGGNINLNASTSKINLQTGGLSRIQAIGQTTIAHAGTAVNHSLGVTPDFVLPVLDGGGANSDVIVVNYGSMTSTQFTAYTSNGVSTGNVRFLVFKF